MMSIRCLAVLGPLAVGVLATPDAAEGAVTITAIEENDGVALRSEGTLDVSGLGVGSDFVAAGGLVFPRSSLDGGGFLLGPPDVTVPGVQYLAFDDAFPSGFPAFGDAGGTIGSSGTGPAWGVDTNQLLVPPTYDGTTELVSTLTFAGASFSSLGMDVGTYVGMLANGDTVTLEVVPVPAAQALLATAIGGLIWARRRQRRQAV